MNIYEAIEKRRTIRSFTRGTTEEIIRKIIIAGTRSISAENSQPWEFIIVDDTQLIEQIAEHKYQLNLTIHPQGVAKLQKIAHKNCSVIAACYKDGPGHLWSMWACIQNMALAATAVGLGIVPTTLWEEHQRAVEKLIDLTLKKGTLVPKRFSRSPNLQFYKV